MVKSALIMFRTAPMLVHYPFLQHHFVEGTIDGAIRVLTVVFGGSTKMKTRDHSSCCYSRLRFWSSPLLSAAMPCGNSAVPLDGGGQTRTAGVGG